MRHWILAAALFALPDATWAGSYEFHLVATLANLPPTVAINDQGEVAWSDGAGLATVYKAAPGNSPTTVDTVDGSDGRVFIDDQGEVGYQGSDPAVPGSAVAFRRGDGGTTEILWGTDGTFQGLQPVSGGFTAWPDTFSGQCQAREAWRMSRAGTFVFASEFTSDPPYDYPRSVFAGPTGTGAFAFTEPVGGSLDARFPYSSSDYGYGDVESLAIGSDGTVAFSEIYSDCTPVCTTHHAHLVRMDGFNPSLVVRPEDRFGSSDTCVDDVNGLADVLFYAYDDVGQVDGIYISRCCGAYEPELVVADDGAYSRLWQAFFNDARTPAFLATITGDPTQHPSGIFSGPDPVADKVITLGDGLLGGTIEPNSLILGGINQSGQIAFAAIIDHGDIGYAAVVRADPVPEPASAAAGLVALSTLYRVVRRRAGERTLAA